jgi:hypothetical protein
MSNNTGRQLVNFIKNNPCRPDKLLYSMVNNNAMGGIHLVDMYVNNAGKLGLKSKKNKRITVVKGRGLGRIGKGADGAVYIGCLDDRCKKMIAIKYAKNGLKIEYDVLLEVFKYSPHIIRPYMFVNCGTTEIFYQQYLSGGDLFSALQKYSELITPIQMKTIIFQIISTLAQLHKKDPSFRHNDLHLKNILLNVTSTSSGSSRYGVFYVPNIGLCASIADFGWAHTSTSRNIKVTSKDNSTDFGVAPDNNRMYDAHLFLNALYMEIAGKPKFREAASYIQSVLPHVYIGNTSQYIMNSRLRYGMKHEHLPTFSKLLFHSYFSEFKKQRNNVTNNFHANTPSPPKPKSPSPPKPKSKSPSPPKPKPKSPSPPKPKSKSPSPPKPKPKSPSLRTSDACGDKAKKVTGIGAQKLTTKEMADLIKRRGHQVPKGQPTRQELCAIIQDHKLAVTPEQGIKQFLASQNVVVEKPKPKVVPVSVSTGPVQFLSNKKLWDLYTKKLTENIYNTLPKEGEYENRMDKARSEAMKKVRAMKESGEAPPAYAKK